MSGAWPVRPLRRPRPWPWPSGAARPVSPIASTSRAGATTSSGPSCRRRVVLAYAVKANPGARLIAAFAGQGRRLRLRLDRRARARPRRRRARLARPLRRAGQVPRGASDCPRDGGQDPGRRHRGHRTARGHPRRRRRVGKPVRVSPPRQPPRASFRGDSRGIAGSSAARGPRPSASTRRSSAPFSRRLCASARVRIAGLQVFAASNERESPAPPREPPRRLRHRRASAARNRQGPGFIDLGGGLGIPYAEGESELDIGRLRLGTRPPSSKPIPGFRGGHSRAGPVARGALRRLPRPRRPHQDEQGGALRRPRGRREPSPAAPAHRPGLSRRGSRSDGSGRRSEESPSASRGRPPSRGLSAPRSTASASRSCRP